MEAFSKLLVTGKTFFFFIFGWTRLNCARNLHLCQKNAVTWLSNRVTRHWPCLHIESVIPRIKPHFPMYVSVFNTEFLYWTYNLYYANYVKITAVRNRDGIFGIGVDKIRIYCMLLTLQLYHVATFGYLVKFYIPGKPDTYSANQNDCRCPILSLEQPCPFFHFTCDSHWFSQPVL